MNVRWTDEYAYFIIILLKVAMVQCVQCATDGTQMLVKKYSKPIEIEILWKCRVHKMPALGHIKYQLNHSHISILVYL
jgi:hypothetical protein